MRTLNGLLISSTSYYISLLNVSMKIIKYPQISWEIINKSRFIIISKQIQPWEG